RRPRAVDDARDPAHPDLDLADAGRAGRAPLVALPRPAVALLAGGRAHRALRLALAHHTRRLRPRLAHRAAAGGPGPQPAPGARHRRARLPPALAGAPRDAG